MFWPLRGVAPTVIATRMSASCTATMGAGAMRWKKQVTAPAPPPPSLGYAGQVSEPIPGEPTKQNISHYQASVRHVSWEIRGERKGEKDQALEEKGDKH